MEHAIYIRKLEGLKHFDSQKFSRVYFGTEFCEKIIPGKKEIDEVLRFCKENNAHLTIVTPWCTEKGIETIRKILPLLPPSTEVVFNDWGALKIINENKLVPVIGRLLVSVKRDPRIGKDKLEYFRKSNLNSEVFQDFLMEKGINRAELDNIKQGYDFQPKKGLKTSIYYPFVYITTSRKCISAGCELPPCESVSCEGKCSFECSKYSFSSSIGDSKIIIKGNSQFYRNDEKPAGLEKLGVNRMVYMPSLPFGAF